MRARLRASGAGPGLRPVAGHYRQQAEHDLACDKHWFLQSLFAGASSRTGPGPAGAGPETAEVLQAATRVLAASRCGAWTSLTAR